MHPYHAEMKLGRRFELLSTIYETVALAAMLTEQVEDQVRIELTYNGLRSRGAHQSATGPSSGHLGAQPGTRTQKLSILNRATLPICPAAHVVISGGIEPPHSGFGNPTPKAIGETVWSSVRGSNPPPSD